MAMRTSVWTSLVARAALVAVALGVLSYIGRRATAATTTPEGPAVGVVDAGPTANTTQVPFAYAGGQAPAIASISSSTTPSAPPTAPSHARATAEDPVYVNQATSDELRRLPGVGAKRAEAIVALRQRVGRFQRLEDLLRVKGVGRATIRKWRPLVRLEHVATDGGG
jgi:competence protein ComEA